MSADERRMAGLNGRAVTYLLDVDPTGAGLETYIGAARRAYASVPYCPRHRPPFMADPSRIYRLAAPRPDGFACDCKEK